MRTVRRLRSRMSDSAIFFREFLRHPRQVASIIPSSPFLERRVIKAGDISSARTVVELGCGTGGLTRAILAALPRPATLLTIEINGFFCSLLREIDDERLIVHCGDARELRKTLGAYTLPHPDVVVSGVPFSILPSNGGSQLLAEISSALDPGGRFVAYQVRSRVADLTRPYLGLAELEFEYLALPPQRVYRWVKNSR